MYKLIAILVALVPVILFLRTMFVGRSKVLSQASSKLKKQIDYLAWGILFIVGCAIVYAVGRLIFTS